jgi:hypothetical protein
MRFNALAFITVVLQGSNGHAEGKVVAGATQPADHGLELGALQRPHSLIRKAHAMVRPHWSDCHGLISRYLRVALSSLIRMHALISE